MRIIEVVCLDLGMYWLKYLQIPNKVSHVGMKCDDMETNLAEETLSGK